jgi:hypothetical protein
MTDNETGGVAGSGTTTASPPLVPKRKLPIPGMYIHCSEPSA